MDQTSIIGGLVRKPLNTMGYDLVRVRLSGGDNLCLQIMAERLDRGDMTVDDCTVISRKLSVLLDENDPISGPYTLEISSPGIDRPLVSFEDFNRFVGFLALIEIRQQVDARKRYRGELGGASGGKILIKVDGELYKLPFGEIESAKLVPTEELIWVRQGTKNKENAESKRKN